MVTIPRASAASSWFKEPKRGQRMSAPVAPDFTNVMTIAANTTKNVAAYLLFIGFLILPCLSRNISCRERRWILAAESRVVFAKLTIKTAIMLLPTIGGIPKLWKRFEEPITKASSLESIPLKAAQEE